MTNGTDRIENVQPRRFRSYAAYRGSGVKWLGEIPAHWSVKRLKFLAPARITRLDSKPDEAVYVGLEHVASWTGRLVLENQPESVDSVVSSFAAGDVLFGKLRPYLAKVARPDFDGVCTSEILALRPAPGCFQAYIMYCLLNAPYIRWLDSLTYGAKMPRVSPDQVGNSHTPLPPESEQPAIADFLDRETAKIDALVARKERLIELLQEKRTALITGAVTRGLDPNVPMKDSGVDWLGEIPVHWEVYRLRRVVSKFVDYRGKTPEKSPFGARLVTAKNVKNQSIDFSLSEEFIPEDLYPQWMVRGRPERGDILITTEAPLGETAQILDADIALAQQIILLKVNTTRITNDYLKYHFAADPGRMELCTRATGSTALGIKASHLKASLVAVPPVYEQEEISRTVDSRTVNVDLLIAKIHEVIDLLKEFRTALISAAVTGKIDVREAVPR